MFKKRKTFKKSEQVIITIDTVDDLPATVKPENIDDTEPKRKKKKVSEMNEDELFERKKKLFDSTATTDYNPLICKPYFETGYCGFGDNCIYRHDREDIVHSYDLEFKKDIPVTINTDCPVCKKEYDTKMELSCKDILCKTCALASAKSKSCLLCKKRIDPSLKPTSILK